MLILHLQQFFRIVSSAILFASFHARIAFPAICASFIVLLLEAGGGCIYIPITVSQTRYSFVLSTGMRSRYVPIEMTHGVG
jgi:hypothetical protein